MQVGIGVAWHVEVEHDVNLLDINTTAKELSGNQDAVSELLEALIDLNSIFEAHSAVDSLGGDGVLIEHLVELDSVVYLANEDDDLVELQLIDEIHQLANLIALVKVDVVLAETVKRELALVLDEDLGGVAHELAAGKLDLVRQSSGEHHHLLAMRSLLKDLLDVAAHIDVVKDLIALVKNEHLEVFQVERLVFGEVENTAWGSNDNVGSLRAL